MFDFVRRRMPWIVAAVMALTVLGQAAVAQAGDGVDPAAVSNINADKVDGRSAVKYTSDPATRAGRLMAFGGTGYLPANIVEGGVATITALQSSVGAVNEADNLVHWNQLLGVPPAVIAADTTITMLGPVTAIAGGAAGALLITYPANRSVYFELYPVTPGGVIRTTGDLVARTADSAAIARLITFANFSATVGVTVGVRLTYFNNGYVSPAKAKDLVTAKFLDKVPKRFRK